jgi:hypothetical protein
VIELVIGIFVALATLFLGLSLEVILGRKDENRVGSTPVDFDLTGYDLPPAEFDLRLKRSKAKESEVDIDLFASEESSDQT